MGKNEDEKIVNNMRLSNFSLIISILFVTMVMLFLFVKIIFL